MRMITRIMGKYISKFQNRQNPYRPMEYIPIQIFIILSYNIMIPYHEELYSNDIVIIQTQNTCNNNLKKQREGIRDCFYSIVVEKQTKTLRFRVVATQFMRVSIFIKFL